MSVALITGSAGLIGSEAVRGFAQLGLTPVGIDNNMRMRFFGENASTQWNLENLQAQVPSYKHHDVDIRSYDDVLKVFKKYQNEISVIVHCAAQPSHDWAASNPHLDFEVNANGTLNMLEAMRHTCPQAVFIHLSTNKVYGDTPNRLPLEELRTRWEIASSHPYFGVGIDETMPIDHCKHSLFGVSKAAGDLMVQEYGLYFGLKTGCFRGGCLTGPAHSGTQLHGFLSYLMRCCVDESPYQVFGYRGKQVRDNIHSKDLVNALIHFYKDPKAGSVYNIGGGPENNCSMLEAIDMCQEISGKTLNWSYQENNRIGDHIWWVSDVRKFQKDYPDWHYEYPLKKMLEEIHAVCQASQTEVEYA